MTTIQLYNGTSTLTIFGAKIKENIIKEVIAYNYPFPSADWGAPSASRPRKEAVDLLTVQRVFTITGYIDKDSISGGTTAPQARDVLVNLPRAGGTDTFRYGVDADKGSYSPSAGNMYYTSTGFEVHITKIQIDEVAEDPTGGIPTQYPVVVTVEHMVEVT